jgi:hypothetical protein
VVRSGLGKAENSEPPGRQKEQQEELNRQARQKLFPTRTTSHGCPTLYCILFSDIDPVSLGGLGGSIHVSDFCFLVVG